MDVILEEPQGGGVHLDRALVRFPVELRPPTGFDPEDLTTWPDVDGRLEFVGGRLLYMPPCGDDQGDVATTVTTALGLWAKRHPEFKVSSNEIGMIFDGESRGAEAAVWLRATLPPNTGGFRRVPAILVVEIQGQDDTEAGLRTKAQWYLTHGARWVWILLPRAREVIVVSVKGARRLGWRHRVPAAAELPGLAPRVSELFAEIGPPKPRSNGSRRH